MNALHPQSYDIVGKFILKQSFPLYWNPVVWSEVTALHMIYIFFFLNSHKRRLSDGSPAVGFPTVSLKIRRSSYGYVVLRRFFDASSCRFCDGYPSLRHLSDACGSNSF